ncbi:MAG: hypothetical protein N3A53_01500 [Verrucomicrobiae bacterium]|nr:hypothetical protein [Verrucomicrobiae bacterium]
MGASLLICAATSWAQTTVDLHEVDVRFTMAFETESYGRPVIRQTTLTARNIIQGADPDAPSNAILVLASNCDEGALGIFVYDPNEGALRAQVLESTDYQLTLVAGTRATVYSLMQVVESGLLLDGVVSFQGTATLREGTCLQSARATFNGVLGVYDEASDSVQGAIITRGSITTKRYVGRITIE